MNYIGHTICIEETYIYHKIKKTLSRCRKREMRGKIIMQVFQKLNKRNITKTDLKAKQNQTRYTILLQLQLISTNCFLLACFWAICSTKLASNLPPAETRKQKEQ